MLLDTATVAVACPKDANLAELEQTGEIEYDLPNGQKGKRPKMEGVYVRGLSFGPNAVTIKAPIPLLKGDVVQVTKDGAQLYTVLRKGKVEWQNEELHAAEEHRKAKQQAIQDARAALR